MKNVIKFIVYIILSFGIFIINDIRVLVGLFIVSIITTFLFWYIKHDFNIKNLLYNFKFFFPFIIFTSILNIIFVDFMYGFLMGIKIVICFIFTYIFSSTISILEIASVIEKLFFPLKLFKINTNGIGIMVSIALCTIPALQNEINQTIKAMEIKGKKWNLKNMNIVMKPVLISIFRKTNEMEKAMLIKGYFEQ